MARTASATIIYEDTEVSTLIEGFLLSLVYTDHGSGKADDLKITLQDREQLWQNDWYPETGDTVRVAIVTNNWRQWGTVETLPCGTFDVDSIVSSGPPDTFVISGITVPINATIRNEEKTKAWENVNLSRIAADIAAEAELQLFFSVAEDAHYDRIDQTEQSDLAFLLYLCEDEGLSLKVDGEKIIIFDDETYEQQPPVMEIIRGETAVLSYSFDTRTADTAYVACQVSYLDPATNKKIEYTYIPQPDEKKKKVPPKKKKRRARGKSRSTPTGRQIPPGPILKINERVANEREAMNLARKRLRQKNKRADRCTFTLVGDTRLAAGETLEVSGWGNFDAKYVIETASHTISNGGYTTTIEIRKVLDY